MERDVPVEELRHNEHARDVQLDPGWKTSAPAAVAATPTPWMNAPREMVLRPQELLQRGRRARCACSAA